MIHENISTGFSIAIRAKVSSMQDATVYSKRMPLFSVTITVMNYTQTHKCYIAIDNNIYYKNIEI